MDRRGDCSKSVGSKGVKHVLWGGVFGSVHALV